MFQAGVRSGLTDEKENYQRKTYMQMSSELGISDATIAAMMKDCSLSAQHTPRNKEYTEEEDSIIRTMYPELGKELVTHLPGRSLSSIQQRASILGIKTNHKQPKKVKCIETDEIFESMSAADKKYGCKVIKCLKYGRKTSGGYHWEYVEDDL